MESIDNKEKNLALIFKNYKKEQVLSLFGMPAAAALPVLLIKSGLLAGAAAFAARYTKKISLVALLGVILAYQVIGTAFEWAICGNFFLAVQDFRIGIPGMLIQWFGGYALLKAISKL